MRSSISLAIFAACASTTASGASSGKDVFVPGGDAGISIHVLHREPKRAVHRVPVLLLHPYAAPCAQAFDVPGKSWMADLAARGFDVYAVDFRGFGRSTAPAGDVPVGRADDAVRDVSAVVDWIRRTTGASKVSLVAWSWGGVVAAKLALESPERLSRLVLLGTMHAFSLPMMTDPLAAKDDPRHFGPRRMAYQRVEVDKVLGHWRMMLAGTSGLVDDATFGQVQALAEACSRTLPAYSAGWVIRPMGPLADLFEIWSNRPIYDASRIRVPALIVRGDRDAFADTGLAKRIPHAEERIIPEATHWVPYEKNRFALYEATAGFLGR